MDKPEKKQRPPKAADPAPRDDVVVSQNRCPFCRDDVRSATAGWVACAACLARHHEPCWGEGGGRCAACGVGERLRADSAPQRRRGVAMLIAVLLVVSAMVVAFVATTRAERARAVALARAQAAAAAAAAAAKREVAERPARPVVEDARFDIARRVDELRRLNRSGSRKDARLDRRKAAWRQASMDLELAKSRAAPEEVVRLVAALKELRRIDPPYPASGDMSGDMPLEPMFDEQDEYFMPPRPEHPEFAALTEARLRSGQNSGFQAHLLVVTGEPQAALVEANRGLDLEPIDWMAWLARGEAMIALGDHRGAAMALTVSEGFSNENPTWALLARVDLAHARGDRAAELAAAWDALEVGQVPEWGGHLQALLERIATLEHELGERRSVLR